MSTRKRKYCTELKIYALNNASPPPGATVQRVRACDQPVADLKRHGTHERQTAMFPAGFETTIPAGERPHTLALNRSATAIGI